jgi:cell division protein FtsQ
VSETRFADRVQDQRRRRWRRIAIGTLVVLGVALVVWVIWFSRVLAVHQVVVDGETTMSESQIRSAAAIRTGEPLARVDIPSIEARIASMERIQNVTVERSWPRTIRIKIVERTPVAWVSVGGAIRGLDRYGVDFRTYTHAPKGLLEVQVTVGDARQRQQTLESVAGLIEMLDSKDPALRKNVQSISASSKDSIELDMTQGRTVVWGSGASSSRKLVVLRALLRIDAQRYDVSAPDQPTTKK